MHWRWLSLESRSLESFDPYLVIPLLTLKILLDCLSRVGVTGYVAMPQAAYHGVPIAALPFFADQPENADKAVGRVGDTNQPLSACTVAVILEKMLLLVDTGMGNISQHM